MARVLPFFASWFIFLNVHAQIDPRKVDSLSKWIDSSAHAYNAQQDSSIKVQDSVYHAQVNQSLQKKSNTDNYLAKQKRGKEKRQETSVRLAWGILILILAVIALAWWRKRNT